MTKSISSRLLAVVRVQTIIHEMRGIPYFLLLEYLQELGGHLDGENRITGDGWQVSLERMEPFRIGSLSVGQTRLIMALEDSIAENFQERFLKKTLRAGG
jgi:hypothetical protein